MRLWGVSTLLAVSLLTFSGCVSTLKPKNKAVVDTSLPIVTLTQSGVYTDMKAVGFEWNSIKDSRVDGIYVYKQTMDEKVAEHKYYDTVKSRFVTHYVDENVEPNTQYSYYFKTFSKDLESQPSQATVVGTLPALDSVSWIYAAQDMPRTAKILWRPHTNQIVKEYILERKTLSEKSWNKLAIIKGRLSAEYIDDNLKDNHVYKYRILVETYNDIKSKPSKEVKVITKALPGEVENIVATKNLPKKIKLNWKIGNVKDFSHFNIYRSEKLERSYKLLSTANNIGYIDELEEDGKDYFYRVSAVDKDGLESVHHKNSAHGKTLIRPDVPSLVEAKMVGDNLEIKWSSNDPRAKSFIVNKGTSKSLFDKSTEEFVDIKGNKFIDTKVEPTTTYTYEVYSVDEFSIKSEASIEVKFSTNEKQGRFIETKDTQAGVNVIKAPMKENNNNIVQPIEDIDMGSL